ncbi:MAG: ABC transporter substrate-binding protein [Acidimicrobiia bacterium]
MKLAHRWRFLLVAVVVSLIAAACGDDDATTTTTTPSLSGQTLEILASWAADSTEGQNFKLVTDAFAAETGVVINYQGASTDLTTVLGTRVEADNPPDVAFLPTPGLLVELADRGVLVEIEDEVGGLVDANYADVWRELGSANGTLYGVWFKGANKSTVWYDVAAFATAGVTAPATWDEWVQVSQDLVDAGIGAVSVGGADGWTLSDWFENVFLRTAGAEAYDQLQNHEIPWNGPEVKEALTVLGQVLTEDFMAGGSAGALQTGFVDSVTKVFTAGDAAVVYEGDFVAGVIIGETGVEAGTGFDFFDFPSIDGSAPAVVGGGDVAVALKDSPAAFAFLNFLASPEAAEIWAAQGGFSSMNRGVDTSVYPDDITRRAAAALANAESFRFDLSDLVPAPLGSTVGAGIWGALQEWLANPGNVDAILDQLESEASAAQG